MQYYEKCLEVAKKCQNDEIEAECYQRIGLIYHELDHFDEAIDNTEKFLKLCTKVKMKGDAINAD